MRSPRQPSAGFASLGVLKYGSCLSLPMSSVRSVTGRPPHALEHPAVEPVLLLFAGELRPLHVHELGPQETHAVAMVERKRVEVAHALDVDLRREGVAVGGDRGLAGVQRELLLARLAALDARQEAIDILGRGAQAHRGGVAIDAHAHALLEARQEVRQPHHAREPEGARQHRAMAVAAARLAHDGQHARTLEEGDDLRSQLGGGDHHLLALLLHLDLVRAHQRVEHAPPRIDQLLRPAPAHAIAAIARQRGEHAIHHVLDGGLGVDALFADGRLDLLERHRIAEHQFVQSEDRSVAFAQLLRDELLLLLDRPGCLADGRVQPRQLARDVLLRHRPRGRRVARRVHDMHRTNGQTGGDGYAFDGPHLGHCGGLGGSDGAEGQEGRPARECRLHRWHWARGKRPIAYGCRPSKASRRGGRWIGLPNLLMLHRREKGFRASRG